MHSHTHVERLGDHAFFIVLVAVDFHEAFPETRDPARGKTGGVEGVAFIVRIGFDDEPFKVCLRDDGIRGDHRFQPILVGEDERGDLVLVRHPERACGEFDPVFDGSRGIDDAREFTVSGIDDQIQVALFGTGRKTGRRTRTLCDMDDRGGFRDPGQTDGFGHQREPTAGGRGHGSRPGIPGTLDHV